MRIQRLKGGASFEIEVKRFRVPFRIWDDCPTCGAETESGETAHYFSYPWVGEPEPVRFCCEDCEDAPVEWERKVLLSLDITAA